ncbi:MAG: alpha/beta hydrolase [Pseudomonadota bacterium]|nr:alpha/beta hydrolase [Pseudomonadota bacterium]
MPFAEIDGIRTRYDVFGGGPPILMYAPGGFNARLEQWTDLGIYKRVKLLDYLPSKYTCIIFDRRENGESGGRLEAVGWSHFVRQGAGLLDELGFERAHLLGGCMGCPPVTAFGVAFPERVLSMILFWPVGGAKYRINCHLRFAQHLSFVEENGMHAVVDLVRSHDLNFSQDPRGGPWGNVIRVDEKFATQYATSDLVVYKNTVSAMCRGLFDRDTAPGAEAEELLALDLPSMIVPGDDEAHATSAARYLHECLAGSEYVDIAVKQQSEDNIPTRVLEFLDGVGD